MPNHIHGILIINDTPAVETRLIASLQTQQIPQTPAQKTGGFAGTKNLMLNNNIFRVIRWYKGICTFNMRKIHAGFQWQSRVHDHNRTETATILSAMMKNTNVSLIISIPIPKIGREINFSNRKNDGQRLPPAPRHRPRLVRICNTELSNRGFVITFIPFR